MKRTFLSFPVLLLALLGLVVSCEKEPLLAPAQPTPSTPPGTLVAPIARAGNDTILYVPFHSHTLNGAASTDPDGKIVSYTWRRITGPAAIDIIITNSAKAFVSNLTQVGVYGFELTVTDNDKLTSKDTLDITVLAPVCSTAIKEVIIKDQVWITPFYTEIQLDPHHYLPSNSFIKNFYIKRDYSEKWELIVPYNHNLDQTGFYTWFYGYNYLIGNNTLVIWPSTSDTEDTPDVKIEYCQ